MSTYTPQRKHAGRPKGRANDDRPVVVVVPCQCPTCGSTEILVETGNQSTQEISGVLNDGRAYDRVTWRRAMCESCGQKIMQRVFRRVRPGGMLTDDEQDDS